MTDGIGDSAPRIVFPCNNMEAVRSAALGGLGIACMPGFLVREPLASGALVRVLPEHADAPGHFHAPWPSKRQLSPKVRAFVDFITERLSKPA